MNSIVVEWIKELRIDVKMNRDVSNNMNPHRSFTLVSARGICNHFNG